MQPKSYQERFKRLNQAQKTAVTHIDGPLMVIAGPGTGKTELLGMRVANILNSTDTPAQNILCLTFTESGQAEMRKRLVDIIGQEGYKVAINTFHSFGSEIIANNSEYFYNGAKFNPASNLEQYEILSSIFKKLPHNNPLVAIMNGEYTNLKDTMRAISHIKRKGGLTYNEFIKLLDQNDVAFNAYEKELGNLFSDRISLKIIPKLGKVLAELKAGYKQVQPLNAFTPIAKIILNTLDLAYQEAEELGKTNVVTAWKNAWMEKDASNNYVFKDRKQSIKLRALAVIYQQYIDELETRGLYDYDDMIMKVLHAIENNPELKYSLQEQYLYILVDEFQDTNPAQLRMLYSLGDNPVNEGAPNIMVVGDDDQSIYGFQGANVSTILNFNKTYKTTKTIVLTENYRSGAEILDSAKQVISQATDRLTIEGKAIDKNLKAQPASKSSVELCGNISSASEYLNIAKAIKAINNQHNNPHLKLGDVAVIARKHKDLKDIIPYLQHEGIKFQYAKEDSVLDQPIILLLELLGKVLVYMASSQFPKADELMPELLAHPAFGVDSKTIINLSLEAYKTNQFWIEAMANEPSLKNLQTWLSELSVASLTLSLEEILDQILDRPVDENQKNPIYQYFFGDDNLKNSPTLYLTYLDSIRSLREHLRRYQNSSSNSDVLKLDDLIKFIELYRKLDEQITISSDVVESDESAVHLLTAHGAKGKEFEVVYILNSNEDIWGEKARDRNTNITFPVNMPIGEGKSSLNERLRLYYVAMTRAKTNLSLHFTQQKNNGSLRFLASFLVDSNVKPYEPKSPTVSEMLTAKQIDWHAPLTSNHDNLKTALKQKLDSFKLTATSLNAFLDVTRGGPKQFLLSNLLRFPSAKSPEAVYGTAIHDSLKLALDSYLSTGNNQPIEKTIDAFTKLLKASRLDSDRTNYYLNKGHDELKQFLASGSVAFNKNMKAEEDFFWQDVVVDGVKITGKLDVIEIDKAAKKIVVTDYKTGKVASSWKGSDDHQKINLHKYKQQLIFYKILVENSSKYLGYHVDLGQIAYIKARDSGENVILELEISEKDVIRTSRLMQIVWNHIKNLDFPDTSSYGDKLSSILDFEEDLLTELNNK